MPGLSKFTQREIQRRLDEGSLPFSGISEMESCEFHFQKPTFYAGIAMHTGRRIRPEIVDALLVGEPDRLREEDTFADYFIGDLPIRIVALDSRFEYDLNRGANSAIYPFEKEKWGMKIWKRELSRDERRLSILKHREFHSIIDIVTNYMLRQNRYAVIFDMHTFCYQREEKRLWFKDPKPEINLGSKPVNRTLFNEVIDNYILDLARIKIENHRVRIGENEIFPGGYLSRRLSKKWYENVLVLALEYKKIFMNEWTGEFYRDILDTLIEGFNSASAKLIQSGIFMTSKS